MASCPCCSEKEYESCCGPYLIGEKSAPTAEALMRSRYTAYVKGHIDYISETTHKSGLSDFDEEASRRWSRESEWQGLEILSSSEGRETDDEGEVEFIARYKQNGEEEAHHEKAIFKRAHGKWFFFDGKVVGPETYIRPDPKIGRNAPCPCGSGKKFKKCCGQ